MQTGIEPQQMNGFMYHCFDVPTFAYAPLDADAMPTGGCDALETIGVNHVNRSWLLKRKTPLVIRGMTEGWRALANWDRESLIAQHGDAPFHLHVDGAVSLGRLLGMRGR